MCRLTLSVDSGPYSVLISNLVWGCIREVRHLNVRVILATLVGTSLLSVDHLFALVDWPNLYQAIDTPAHAGHTGWEDDAGLVVTTCSLL
jgi:hypothetical protein